MFDVFFLKFNIVHFLNRSNICLLQYFARGTPAISSKEIHILGSQVEIMVLANTEYFRDIFVGEHLPLCDTVGCFNSLGPQSDCFNVYWLLTITP